MTKNIIWIHGFGEDSTMWEDFIEPIEGNHFLFNFSKTQSNSSINDYAKDLLEYVKQNNISSPILIGHSMGGYIALEYAAIFGNVSALGLFHSTAAEDSDIKKKERVKVREFILKSGSRAFIENFYPNIFGPKFLRENNDFISENIAKYSQIPSEALAAATESMRNRKSHKESLSQFAFPVFQILGRSDKLINFEDCLDQALSLNRPSLLVLDEIGHAGMHESPHICQEFIKDFLLKI